MKQVVVAFVVFPLLAWLPHPARAQSSLEAPFNEWSLGVSHGLRSSDPRSFAEFWYDYQFASGLALGLGAGEGERLRGDRDPFHQVRIRWRMAPVAALGGARPRIGLEYGSMAHLVLRSGHTLLGSIGLATPDGGRLALAADLMWGRARADDAWQFRDEDAQRSARPLLLRLTLSFRH